MPHVLGETTPDSDHRTWTCLSFQGRDIYSLLGAVALGPQELTESGVQSDVSGPPKFLASCIPHDPALVVLNKIWDIIKLERIIKK